MPLYLDALQTCAYVEFHESESSLCLILQLRLRVTRLIAEVDGVVLHIYGKHNTFLHALCNGHPAAV